MKKIMFWLLVVSFMVMTPVSAQEADSTPTLEDDYYRTEVIMTNTMHQFVYAFFGRDMLLNYLVDPDDVRVIREARTSDLKNFSKPFNTLMSKFVMAGMVGVYWLTVGYFLLRLAAFSSEYGWLLQRKGTTPMDKEVFKSFSIRLFLLAGLAVAPMSVNLEGNRQFVGLYNLFLFDLIGKAHQMGDDALADMVTHQRPSLASIRIPHADSRWDSGLALNDFMTCLRLDASRQNQASTTERVEFHLVDGGIAEGILNLGRCNLRIQYGYDRETEDILKKLKAITPSLPVEPELFTRAQVEVFKKLSETLAKQAREHSEILSKPIYQESLISFNNKERAFATAGWTSDQLSEYELEKWESQCDNLANYRFPYDSISNRDREVFHLISARCISKEITKNLLYPEVFGNTTEFFENQSLRNRHLPLCIDAVSFSQSLDDSRFVPRYQLNPVSDATSEKQSQLIDNLALDSCLSQYCSQNSLLKGGLYSCVNALDMYHQRQKDYAMQERGILMLGFYMFNLYSNQIPTDRAKHIYQSTRFDFF